MTCKTLLLRQVNPNWIGERRGTSQAFKPTAKDQGKSSVYDGDQITAQGALQHYCQELGLKSAGVLALTVTDCRKQDLAAKPDPEPFPEHVVIDFRASPRCRLLPSPTGRIPMNYRIFKFKYVGDNHIPKQSAPGL